MRDKKQQHAKFHFLKLRDFAKMTDLQIVREYFTITGFDTHNVDTAFPPAVRFFLCGSHALPLLDAQNCEAYFKSRTEKQKSKAESRI